MGIFDKNANRISYDYNKLLDVEGDRLQIQKSVTKEMDQPIVDDIIAKLSGDGAYILDIGCNEGDCTFDRLEGKPIASYLGIDLSKAAIKEAESKHGDVDSGIYFSALDVESPDVVAELRAIMRSKGIPKINFVMVSMVLLHMNNPQKLLKALYDILSPGGYIFIRDIDDRNAYASSDPHKMFAKSFELVKHNTIGGNRNSGRSVPKYLQNVGYSNITTVASHLSTLGKPLEKRLDIFHTYYDFQLPNVRDRIDEDSTDDVAVYDYGWWLYYMPYLESSFHDEQFEFRIGFMTFTARKD